MLDNLLCRAKRKNNNEWIEGYYVKHLPFTPYVAQEVNESEYEHFIIKDGFSDWGMERNTEHFQVIPETIRRYTRYHECNNDLGKKIFKGDLLQSIHDCEEQYEVVWELGGWMIKDSTTIQYLDELVGELELIGDIYDKEEL